MGVTAPLGIYTYVGTRLDILIQIQKPMVHGLLVLDILMDTRTIRGSLQCISVPSRPEGRGIPVIVPFTSCWVSCDGPGVVVILQFTSCWGSCEGLPE